MFNKTFFNTIAVLIVAYGFLSCKQKETASEKKTPIEYKTSNTNSFIDIYPNGKLKVKGQFKGGVRDSLWISYYPNGVTQSENYYKDSILNGNSVVYYSDGRIRYMGFYLDGKKHGIWKFIDQEGIEKEIWFKHGNKK